MPVIKVFECDATGACVEVTKNMADITQLKNDWNLPIRDMRMFIQGDSSASKDGLPVILSRPSSQCFLVNMDHIKLICRKDVCLILNAEDPSVKLFAEELQKHLRRNNIWTMTNENDSHNNLRMLIKGEGNGISLSRRNAMPAIGGSPNNKILNGLKVSKTKSNSSNLHLFLDAVAHTQEVKLEFAVLEATLATITGRFKKHLNLLKPILDVLLHQTLLHPSRGILRRMLAFMKNLNAFEMSVTMVRSAIEEILKDEEDLVGLCLDKPDKSEADKMELLLEAYSSDLKEIECEVANIKEQVDDTNEFMNIHLNTIRNSFMKMSMLLEMGTFIVGLGTLVAGLFGMNVPHGFEEAEYTFMIISVSIVAGIALTGASVYFFIRRYTSVNLGFSSVEGTHALTNFLDFAKLVDRDEARDNQDAGVGTTSASKKDFKKVLEPVIGTKVTDQKLEKIYKSLFLEDNTRRRSSFFYGN